MYLTKTDFKEYLIFKYVFYGKKLDWEARL